jgi:hypothetical protein
MCAPCKLLLNSSGIAGTLAGIEKAIAELNKRGYDITPDGYQKGVDLICGFHKDLQEFEHLIVNGPHVPFEHKLIFTESGDEVVIHASSPKGAK